MVCSSTTRNALKSRTVRLESVLHACILLVNSSSGSPWLGILGTDGLGEYTTVSTGCPFLREEGSVRWGQAMHSGDEQAGNLADQALAEVSPRMPFLTVQSALPRATIASQC